MISARAEFQMEASPARSGHTIDGVLMMSGFTDKLRATPVRRPIVRGDGNQTPRPVAHEDGAARAGGLGVPALGQTVRFPGT